MEHNWMAELAKHYEKMRQTYPKDKLLILFDIDGTILDMRHLVLFVLKRYDRIHQTDYFNGLEAADITVHENQIDALLAALHLDPETQRAVIAWFEREAWQAPAILEAHRPLAGVLEVLRWFQLQPQTFVGLNTGRLENLRVETLRSLNQLGRAFKVQFEDRLLYMNPNSWAEPVTASKISGIRHFQTLGYRIVAFIDNEPANLQAVEAVDPDHEILLLHADTIFQSKRVQLPLRAVGGNQYDLAELVTEKSLPAHIHFVWHNLNDTTNLVQFLASDVFWGEFVIGAERLPASLNGSNGNGSDETGSIMWRLENRNKGLKFSLTAGGQIIDELLDLVDRQRLRALWFNAAAGVLDEGQARRLASAHPEAIVQVTIDDLAAEICGGSAAAAARLDQYSQWGISRFGISWQTAHLPCFLDQMEQWGYKIDIYDVRDLEQFLRATLLMPSSVTSTFNFPKWRYYGAAVNDSVNKWQP